MLLYSNYTSYPMPLFPWISLYALCFMKPVICIQCYSSFVVSIFFYEEGPVHLHSLVHPIISRLFYSSPLMHLITCISNSSFGLYDLSLYSMHLILCIQLSIFHSIHIFPCNILFCSFYLLLKHVADRPTDQPTDQPTARRTLSCIELQS